MLGWHGKVHGMGSWRGFIAWVHGVGSWRGFMVVDKR